MKFIPYIGPLFIDKECEFITFTAGHLYKCQEYRSTVNLFVLMIMRNTIPNRIDVVIYLKSIFFSEKFVNTDTEISENKKPIRNFRLGCSKAFYVRLPRILKGN